MPTLAPALRYLGICVHIIDSANEQGAGSYGDEIEVAIEEYWNWRECDKVLGAMDTLDPAWEYSWVELEQIPEDDCRTIRAALVKLANQ